MVGDLVAQQQGGWSVAQRSGPLSLEAPAACWELPGQPEVVGHPRWAKEAPRNQQSETAELAVAASTHSVVLDLAAVLDLAVVVVVDLAVVVVVVVLVVVVDVLVLGLPRPSAELIFVS